MGGLVGLLPLQQGVWGRPDCPLQRVSAEGPVPLPSPQPDSDQVLQLQPVLDLGRHEVATKQRRCFDNIYSN